MAQGGRSLPGLGIGRSRADVVISEPLADVLLFLQSCLVRMSSGICYYAIWCDATCAYVVAERLEVGHTEMSVCLC